MSKDYNAGLDTAARIVEEVIGDSPEGETILCGIESSKKTDIVAEIADDNQVRPLICDPENYPEDSDYCETCGSCGETGCCPPINCQAVKCKYGEINLKDYKCFQNQWEIMFNALQAIKNSSDEPSSLEELNHGAFWITNKERAENALKAVDKEWDKLYSKE